MGDYFDFMIQERKNKKWHTVVFSVLKPDEPLYQITALLEWRGLYFISFLGGDADIAPVSSFEGLPDNIELKSLERTGLQSGRLKWTTFDRFLAYPWDGAVSFCFYLRQTDDDDWVAQRKLTEEKGRKFDPGDGENASGEVFWLTEEAFLKMRQEHNIKENRDCWVKVCKEVSLADRCAWWPIHEVIEAMKALERPENYRLMWNLKHWGDKVK